MAVQDVFAGLSRESRIRRDREGRWFDGGVAVTHRAIAGAFDRWIDRADDGRYILRNAINWVYVEIEGPPILVKTAHVREDGMIDLALSDETDERLHPETLRVDGEGALWCDVRGGKMPARFTRVAQLALEPIVAEDEQGVYLAIGSERIRPRHAADV
jgi:uncharacterized protein